MAEVRLRPAARNDFLDIGDQTRDRWSKAQAERYLSQILEVIAEIGRHPFVGAEVGWVRPDYRRRRAGSHLIFYVITGEDLVEVVRILHERSDIPRRLDV